MVVCLCLQSPDVICLNDWLITNYSLTFVSEARWCSLGSCRCCLSMPSIHLGVLSDSKHFLVPRSSVAGPSNPSNSGDKPHRPPSLPVCCRKTTAHAIIAASLLLCPTATNIIYRRNYDPVPGRLPRRERACLQKVCFAFSSERNLT